MSLAGSCDRAASSTVVDVGWALAEELDTYDRRDSASLSDMKVSEKMTSY